MEDGMLMMFLKFLLQFVAFVAAAPLAIACLFLRTFGLSHWAEKAQEYLARV